MHVKHFAFSLKWVGERFLFSIYEKKAQVISRLGCQTCCQWQQTVSFRKQSTSDGPELWKWTSEYWVDFKTGKSAHIKMCKSPVGIWPHLSDFGLLLPSQNLIWVGNIEEEILHVNRRWWIYPALQNSTVLSQCDLLWMKRSQRSRESTKEPENAVCSKRLNSMLSFNNI